MRRPGHSDQKRGKETDMITDLTGKAADALKAKNLWLLDMDGTIYNRNAFF